jgi:hypothetical protein
VIRRLAGFSGVVLLALLLTSSLGPAQTARAQTVPVPPGAEELAAHAVALTAPAMEGRGSGTPGGELAARYIEERLAAAGLRPGGDAGGWRQSFVLRPGTRLGTGNALARTGAAPLALDVSRDWTPHGGAPSGDVEAELAFVGAAPGAAGESMGAGVNGKIVLVVEGGPTRIERLIAARRAGAAALLVVGDTLPLLERTAVSVGLPSATVTPAAADVLLAPAGLTLAALTRTPAAPGGPTPVVGTGVTARLAIRLEPADRRADNVIGVLPGTDPALAGQSVVIGAHYDHLGRVGGDVYHGADDNASGSAVVLGLAQAFAAAGGAPRALVFILFSGEEVGLIGSGHYVRHPVLPLERAAAMVNFDMVGRMREGRATVSGVESGDALRALVTAAAAGEPLLALTYRDSPFSASDQARFYAAGVPVLFFTTGRHPDYHKPTDTADKLDTAGMARIAAVGLRTVSALAAAPRPVYAKVAPSAGGRAREASGARPAGGAFLGVTGDREGGEGLRIGGIVPDSGAERGGLRSGDVVIRIDDSGVNGFEDLVAALGRRRPGETARVVYLRDGEIFTAPITLGERP